MSIYSASYNFPQGFLWGIVTPDSFYSEKTNNVTLFSLKEKGIKAIFLTLKWADFEPLKNNYEESLIDDVRTLLSRNGRTLNMNPTKIFFLLKNSILPRTSQTHCCLTRTILACISPKMLCSPGKAFLLIWKYTTLFGITSFPSQNLQKSERFWPRRVFKKRERASGDYFSHGQPTR